MNDENAKVKSEGTTPDSHVHKCTECKAEFLCDCPFPEQLEFPDCFGLCPTCREK